MLALVHLARLEAGLAEPRRVDRDADLDQPAAVPADDLRADEDGGRRLISAFEQGMERVRLWRAVVVQQPDPLLRTGRHPGRLRGAREGVETGLDGVAEPGRPRPAEHRGLPERCDEYVDRAVGAAGVDSDHPLRWTRLRCQRRSALRQPRRTVMAHQDSRDGVVREVEASGSGRHSKSVTAYFREPRAAARSCSGGAGSVDPPWDAGQTMSLTGEAGRVTNRRSRARRDAQPARRLSRRRSRSDSPPQIPNRSSWPRAYSKQSPRTAQRPHTRLASRVEPPFSGKNASGSVCAQSASSCQGKDSGVSSSSRKLCSVTTPPSTRAVTWPSRS